MEQLHVWIVKAVHLVKGFHMNVEQKFHQLKWFTAYHAFKAVHSPPIMILGAVFLAVHPVQKISWLIKLAQQHQMSNVHNSVTARTGIVPANLKNGGWTLIKINTSLIAFLVIYYSYEDCQSHIQSVVFVLAYQSFSSLSYLAYLQCSQLFYLGLL